MKIDIVTNTYNRKDILIETLKAFAQQSYKNFEMIIADDGSTDGTEEAIKRLNLPFRIRYFFQEHSGHPGGSRNLALKHSKNEIVFFTGDDIIPSKDLLKEHVQSYYSGDKNLAVLGYTKWAPQIKQTPFRKYLSNYHFSYAYEDAEFGYRASLKGMKLIFNQKALAYHNHPVNFKDYRKNMFNKGAAAVLLKDKIPPLQYKANYNETKNQTRLFFKKIIFNNFVIPMITETINFLDKLFVPFPKIVYYKVMDYYRVKGIKQAKNEK